MRTAALQISIIIILYLFFVALCEEGFSTPIPAGTSATRNGRQDAPSWAYQKRSLPEHEKNFWRILASLVPNLITIVICLIAYRYLRRVSYREDETKQELSHTMLLLEKGENFVLELTRGLAFLQQLKERRIRFQNKVDSVKMIVKLKDKRLHRIYNEMDSLQKMIKVEDKQHVQLLNEVETLKTDLKETHTQHAILQDKVDLMKTMVMKLEDECRAQTQKELDPMKTRSVEDERTRRSQNEIDSLKIVEEEGEHTAHSQNEVDSVKIMEVEGEHTAHSQNEVDSVKIMEVEDEHSAHSQNEVGSVNVITERLPLMLTEEIVGDPASMESSVKMDKFKGNKIVASKPSDKGRMKIQISKVRVGLAPPPNVEAARAKVVSRSNPIHKPSESHVKIHNKKLDYSKIPAKVKLMREIQV
jgi:hypothetical protein